eukprot:scaffold60406_cov56-Phaeocystis_antarctica.AAC.3
MRLRTSSSPSTMRPARSESCCAAAAAAYTQRMGRTPRCSPRRRCSRWPRPNPSLYAFPYLMPMLTPMPMPLDGAGSRNPRLTVG